MLYFSNSSRAAFKDSSRISARITVMHRQSSAVKATAQALASCNNPISKANKAESSNDLLNFILKKGKKRKRYTLRLKLLVQERQKRIEPGRRIEGEDGCALTDDSDQSFPISCFKSRSASQRIAIKTQRHSQSSLDTFGNRATADGSKNGIERDSLQLHFPFQRLNA